MKNHTFVICAYKESPYLEESILSLKNQTVKSNIIMATSTPNEWIQSLAEKYEIPLYINTGDSGIAQDWNFAYRQAKTDYVTIAHQDDTYEPDYLKMVMKGLKKAKDPIIAFTDYGELRDGQKVRKSTLLTIKRILLLPIRARAFQNVKFFKNLAILKFEGIDNINDIEMYKGRELWIPREEAQELGEDEYYVADLIGMEVLLENGEKFGVLRDVMETGANDVYIVDRMDGEEILLPAIHDCVLDVDVEKNTMTVHLMKGLV